MALQHSVGLVRLLANRTPAPPFASQTTAIFRTILGGGRLLFSVRQVLFGDSQRGCHRTVVLRLEQGQCRVRVDLLGHCELFVDLLVIVCSVVMFYRIFKGTLVNLVH